MEKRTKQKLFLISALGIISLGGYFLFKSEVINLENAENQLKTADQTTGQKPVELLFVGDIMLDRSVELKIQDMGNGDYSFPFQKIADTLKEADRVFGNLEGPISDKGTKVGSIYSFRMDPRAIDGLIFAGFNVLSVANNHSLDYGRQALEDTYDRLQNAGINYVGGGLNASEAGKPVVEKIGNVKIAFLAYTDLCSSSWKPTQNGSGINCITADDLEKVKQDVSDAKKTSDFVIVSLHSGTEYSQSITSFQADFAHATIDAGADLVVGHHPHVVQRSEQYKGKWIFYSLGNFIFDQSFSEETMQGMMVKILIKNKQIEEVIPVNTRLNDNFQVEIATSSPAPSEVKSAETAAPPVLTPVAKTVSLSSAAPCRGIRCF